MFDQGARAVTKSTPEGRQVTASLDSAGRVLRETSFGLAPKTFVRDARGRVSSVAQGGRVLSATYDAFDGLASLSGPLGLNVNMSRNSSGALDSLRVNGLTTAYVNDGEGRPLRVGVAGWYGVQVGTQRRREPQAIRRR